MDPQAAPNTRHAEHWSVWLAAALGLAVLAVLTWWLVWPDRVPVVPATVVAAAAPGKGAESASPGPGGTATTPDAARAAQARGPWSRLPEEIQVVLAPLQEDWPELTVDQRQKWYDLAQRFRSFPPDEQQRVQARMADWARMTPAERGVARLNFQEIRQISQKERLERWEAYQGLEQEERRQWTERAQASTAVSASPRRSETSGGPVPKSSGATSEALAAVASQARPAGATVVQAPLGATTLFVSRLPAQVQGAAAGPKIAATSEFVDRATLLPTPVRSGRAGSGAAGGAEPSPSPVPASEPAAESQAHAGPATGSPAGSEGGSATPSPTAAPGEPAARPQP